jgi:hypothetical protein
VPARKGLRALSIVSKTMKIDWESKPRVIVQRSEPLKDDDITKAFAGVSDTVPWWVALVQLIEATRRNYIGRASSGVDRGNALSVARDIGAHEALSELLDNLETRRTKFSDRE